MGCRGKDVSSHGRKSGGGFLFEDGRVRVGVGKSDSSCLEVDAVIIAGFVDDPVKVVCGVNEVADEKRWRQKIMRR